MIAGNELLQKSTFDIAELERYLGSIQYTIPTKSILDLQTKVEEWISMNDCGAIVYGEARVGKTRAIRYISTHLKEKYSLQLPIYTFTATDHVPTQKTFYASLLAAIGHEDPHRGTAVQMRQRLVNRIIADALDTKYRRAILFIDEAYLLSDKEYVWLIDIYNELNLQDILFTVFLFGTDELKQQKSGYIIAGKKQIVLRFMVNEFEFWGITNQRDAAICMASIDKPIRIDGFDNEIILSKLFFPLAYQDGMRLSAYATDLWKAFECVKSENKIHSDHILMKYFMDTVLYCLKRYGVFGNEMYHPTIEEWKQSIIDSGFVISQM
ncbi:MAG: ATP-binding protein [Lachnospiraceae bacterium]|nr:ATP-binding protein [Lachnospiraceae bacterium]